MKQLFILPILLVFATASLTPSIAVPAASPAQTPGKEASGGPAASKGVSVKGWELLQDNPHTGEWHVFLSNFGMAAVNKKMGCTLVAKAPDWNIVMYNDKTKVYFLSPLSEWKGAQSSLKSSAKTRQAYSRATSSLIEKPPKKLKDEMILGHKTTLYLTDNLVTTGLKKVEFSITPDIQVPMQLQQIFAKIYGVGLTKLKGLPLKVSYIDENGKRSPVFDTRRIQPQMIPMEHFSYPADYKRVDSEIAVLMDEKGREAMASIMDDLGEGEGEDLDSLLDEKPKSGTKSKASSSEDGGLTEDEGTGDSSSSSSASTTAVAEGNEFDSFMGMLLPAVAVLAALGIAFGAFLFLKKKK